MVFTILNSRKKPLRHLAAGASPARGTSFVRCSVELRWRDPHLRPSHGLLRDASAKSTQTDRWL